MFRSLDNKGVTVSYTLNKHFVKCEGIDIYRQYFSMYRYACVCVRASVIPWVGLGVMNAVSITSVWTNSVFIVAVAATAATLKQHSQTRNVSVCFK